MDFENIKKCVVAVLLGGMSKEREISLKSGHGVMEAMKELGLEKVVEIDVGHDLASNLKENRVEIAFIALHGRYGEDGAVQGLLEFMKIPYTGSGILGSAVSMNKVLSKKIFSEEKLSTPPYDTFCKSFTEQEIRKRLDAKGIGFPLVVKPSCEGSTIGLSVVEKASDLKQALKVAFDHDEEIVVEKFVDGTEVTVGILDGKALPLVEIAPKEGIFDFKAKYTKGMTEYFVPARVSAAVASKSQDLASKAFKALCCSGFGRVDLMVDKTETPYLLEVNSIPGMTGTSLLPMAAKEIGLSYADLVRKLLEGASLKIGR
jgi:D-alanine-D-alanine ligase